MEGGRAGREGGRFVLIGEVSGSSDRTGLERCLAVRRPNGRLKGRRRRQRRRKKVAGRVSRGNNVDALTPASTPISWFQRVPRVCAAGQRAAVNARARATTRADSSLTRSTDYQPACLASLPDPRVVDPRARARARVVVHAVLMGSRRRFERRRATLRKSARARGNGTFLPGRNCGPAAERRERPAALRFHDRIRSGF